LVIVSMRGERLGGDDEQRLGRVEVDASSTRSVPSTFETKRKVMSRSL
jgi:hypothetical protein